MKISEKEIIHIRRGALLHDIGKIGIPDYVLLKTDKLSEAEWTIMKKHPEYAYHFLSRIKYLQKAADIPFCHHEKWDGSGYPRGLTGNEIPLPARIFTIVDVWDALNSNRPYRKSWPKAKIIEYLKERSGKDFDPNIIKEFIKMINEGIID